MIEAWIAGLISADGHISNRRPPIVEVISTHEGETGWAEYVASVLRSETDLQVNVLGPYKPAGLMKVTAAPCWRVYQLLLPVSHLVLERKWIRLAEYCEPYLVKHERHLTAFRDLEVLLREGSKSKYAAAYEISCRYDLPMGTVQEWAYGNQRPRLLRGGV
jgi:hypothetical protein